MASDILLIVTMLILSAFFSGMEIAFLSKNRLREEIDRKQHVVFRHVADIFSHNPGNYITTILVGNNIALVIYSLSMSALLAELFDMENVVVVSVVSTIIVLFVAEYLPKSIVKRNPNFYYSLLAPVIYLFYIVLYPVSRLTTLLSYGLLRLSGHRTQARHIQTAFSRDDLAGLVEADNVEVQHEDENDIKLFQNALDFADLRVRDCMVPRVDIEAVDIDDTDIEQLTRRFVDSNFSRIFVWRESIDNIVGYVNSKNLFKNPASIDDMLMKTIYVAETLPLQTMLETFMKRKASIAVVIDEFGGTAGIISLEDVLEQIFGEIEDEHDVQELIEKQVAADEWVFSARLEVDYLNEHYGLGIEESDEYDTLAGYIIYNHDGIPAQGEAFAIGAYRCRVLRRIGSRIDLVRLKRLK
ncbi:MAG: hemolysin family protein [Alistipes sp.]|nr:hemolysin family protein [Alistipes sp.]